MYIYRSPRGKKGTKQKDRAITPIYRAFRNKHIFLIRKQMREQLWEEPIPDNRYAVNIILSPSDNTRRDIDNYTKTLFDTYTKTLFDTMTKAGVWCDDSQVIRLSIYKIENIIDKTKPAQCFVQITKVATISKEENTKSASKAKAKANKKAPAKVANYRPLTKEMKVKLKAYTEGKLLKLEERFKLDHSMKVNTKKKS
ncbi:hypothetical protein CKF54_00965 [Psittacicella hinzii]|uniref:Uncharacterized protein n=2 Tax=Psittacicella hinzii TaxID=2028575 RepID=A0A3A1YAH9_9GAMM|nr:hypothetical protein CKF54_00965 [Psittacicella hinzii]